MVLFQSWKKKRLQLKFHDRLRPRRTISFSFIVSGTVLEYIQSGNFAALITISLTVSISCFKRLRDRTDAVSRLLWKGTMLPKPGEKREKVMAGDTFLNKLGRVTRINIIKTRLQLVSAGVGYEVGIPLPEELMSRYRIKANPIPNDTRGGAFVPLFPSQLLQAAHRRQRKPCKYD